MIARKENKHANTVAPVGSAPSSSFPIWLNSIHQRTSPKTLLSIPICPACAFSLEGVVWVFSLVWYRPLVSRSISIKTVQLFISFVCVFFFVVITIARAHSHTRTHTHSRGSISVLLLLNLVLRRLHCCCMCVCVCMGMISLKQDRSSLDNLNMRPNHQISRHQLHPMRTYSHLYGLFVCWWITKLYTY